MNIKGHFETITRHKLLVMKYCFACGPCKLQLSGGINAAHIAAAAGLLVLVAVARVAAQTRDDARMLERLVGIVEHRAADGRNAGVNWHYA